jgi:hypothetical protein
MKIRIIRTCILHDGLTAVQGQVFESFPDFDANALIVAEKAEEWHPLENRLDLPATIEAREPEPEHRDPIPAKRGRGRPRKTVSRMP